MIELFESTDGALAFLLTANTVWLLVFLVVVYFAVRGGDEDRDLRLVEGAWLVIVAVVWIGVNAHTISAMAVENPDVEETVEVQAFMWGYEFSDRSVPVDEPVEFQASSRDTIHSFSVYDSNGDLLFTMMLVPGTEQRTVHTFESPGVYKVRCLEYCGTGHASMTGSFEVVEG